MILCEYLHQTNSAAAHATGSALSMLHASHTLSIHFKVHAVSITSVCIYNGCLCINEPNILGDTFCFVSSPLHILSGIVTAASPIFLPLTAQPFHAQPRPLLSARADQYGCTFVCRRRARTAFSAPSGLFNPFSVPVSYCYRHCSVRRCPWSLRVVHFPPFHLHKEKTN